jgi:outer membrane biogenesis lipoprotein LolB
MKKRTLLLLALPLCLLTACSQEKKSETNQNESLTEEASDPHVRAEEYESGTHDDRADTIPPVNPDTVQAP